MIGPLVRLAGRDQGILVGPETGDDAGVYSFHEHALVATADFITPVCDDPRRFGRVAAANSLSDVYAMGGRPLFALNLCCFPDLDAEDAPALQGILEGAAATLAEARTALLGGHSVKDPELKYGLAVIGEADRNRLLTNAKARPGDRLVLTKPLGTGVLINAYKKDRIDEAALEPALKEMERLNAEACRMALLHGVHAATDITGFGLTGHALGMAKASGVGMRIVFGNLPVHENFYRLVEMGVSTGSTKPNEANVAPVLADRVGLDPVHRAILFDPQTSGGLLLSTPPDQAGALVSALRTSGHQAAEIGEVVEGPAGIEVV
jgi:selenide, water dikinase